MQPPLTKEQEAMLSDKNCSFRPAIQKKNLEAQKQKIQRAQEADAAKLKQAFEENKKKQTDPVGFKISQGKVRPPPEEINEALMKDSQYKLKEQLMKSHHSLMRSQTEGGQVKQNTTHTQAVRAEQQK